MNRIEYMKKLEDLLQDIPAEEREDAINYYNDYFDAGGLEHEHANIEALGSPEELAKTIRLASSGANIEDGEFSEIGYSDGSANTANAVDKYTRVAKTDAPKTKQKMNTGTIILIVILCVFALPIIAPVAVGLLAAGLGITAALVAVVLALLIAFIAAGIGCLIGGVAGIVGCVGGLATLAWNGPVILGTALVLLALGLLFLAFGIFVAIKGFPPLIRGIVAICQGFIGWIKRLFAGKSRKEITDNEQ